MHKADYIHGSFSTVQRLIDEAINALHHENKQLEIRQM
jgi:hypothetical protein